MDQRAIGNARGSIFIHIRDYVIKVHGKMIWGEILNRLSRTDGEIFGEQLIKHGWYSAPALNRLIGVYDNMFGSGNFESIVPVVEYIAQQDLAPVFDIFINLKPSFVLSSAPSLWNRYFDTGMVKIQVADESERHYRLVLEEIADENSVSGRAICTYANPTWLKSALIMAGIKTVTINHDQCRYKNASSCVLDIRWDE
jgi:hypothetical protein